MTKTLDMGSGGNLLLPDQPGPNPHLVIGIGKLGTIYLVNRDSMGGFNASMDQMVQEVSGANRWNVQHTRVLAGKGGEGCRAEHDLHRRGERSAEEFCPRPME